jgi:hypothetical protein
MYYLFTKTLKIHFRNMQQGSKCASRMVFITKLIDDIEPQKTIFVANSLTLFK